jgi:pSer/pThr/pTyr-binding forkhead associated (FHA) protein
MAILPARSGKVEVMSMNEIGLSQKDDAAVTQACLIGTEGEYRGQVVGLSNTTRWGRHPRNDVCLSDATVSAFHMQITRVGRDYEVMDLGSKNGTRLNGRYIRQPAILEDQDTIAIGDCTFRFRLPPSAGGPASESNSGTRGRGARMPQERPQAIEPARHEPVIESPDEKRPVSAVQVVWDHGKLPRTDNDRGGRRRRVIVGLVFCALQILIVALALWLGTEKLAGNTDGESRGQAASTAAMSPQDAPSPAVPLRQASQGQQSPPLPEGKAPSPDANTAPDETLQQADHGQDTPTGDQQEP